MCVQVHMCTRVYTHSHVPQTFEHLTSPSPSHLLPYTVASAEGCVHKVQRAVPGFQSHEHKIYDLCRTRDLCPEVCVYIYVVIITQ